MQSPEIEQMLYHLPSSHLLGIACALGKALCQMSEDLVSVPGSDANQLDYLGQIIQ